MSHLPNSVVELLEVSAKRTPDKIAVIDTKGSRTYQELYLDAIAVGAALSGKLKRNAPVVLFLEKSKEALALMFGTAYAGGFYAFVSKEQPAQRLEKIFSGISPAVVIAEREDHVLLQGVLKAAGIAGTFLMTPEELLDRKAGANEGTSLKPASGDELLYAVYTSGSTGDPKGVAVSHRSVLDFIGHFTKAFGIQASDTIGNQAPFDFDVSVKDIYSAIYTGATLVLIPKQYFSMTKDLLDYLCEKEVNVLIWAVSAMCMISGLKGFSYRIPEKLRLVMFSGEVMPGRHLKIWQNALPDAEFVNLYGPSEITCNCTYYRVTEPAEKDTKLPIGIPFEGRKIHLLDPDELNRTETEAEKNAPDLASLNVGEGKVGEICVSGESLAEGYYRDPVRTAQSFRLLRNGSDGQMLRIYRTGDLGHYDAEGMLCFDGRADSQIKHMGHRIELGEVEHAMLALDGINRVCCIFSEEKNKLFGFYVGELEPNELRVRMKDSIPVYMIPSKLERLEQFRLNKNGKIDRTWLKEHHIYGRA